MDWQLATLWLLLLFLSVMEITMRRCIPLKSLPLPKFDDKPFSALKLILLAGTALAFALARFIWAERRVTMNVDESAFAALAEFFNSTGSSIFSFPWILRLPILAYLPGNQQTHQIWANGFASFSSGMTAFILGLLMLRCQRSKSVAIWTIVAYSVGILPFEGLTANKEPFANLFIAAYLYARLSGTVFTNNLPLLQVTRGLLLGTAFAFKDQTAPIVLLEPIFQIWELRATSAAQPFRKLVISQLYAAAGFFIIPGAILLGFLFYGQFWGYIDLFTKWLTTGGMLVDGMVFEEQPVWIAMFSELSPLLKNPLTFLGLSVAIQILGTPKHLREPEALRLGLTLAVLISVASTCIGKRWFIHYFMLTLPALAPLIAIRIVNFWKEVRTPKLRWPVIALWFMAPCPAILFGPDQNETRSYIEGLGMSAAGNNRMKEVADHVRRLTRPEDSIQVWGWQPEFYTAAQRRPASRFIELGTGMADMIPDFEHFGRPGAVVVIGPNHDGVFNEMDYYYAFRRHPQIRDWILTNGYKRIPALYGYYILISPDCQRNLETKQVKVTL